MDAMPFLQHHNTMIAQVALARFLYVGAEAMRRPGRLAEEHADLPAGGGGARR